jgi:hypothetical protein
MSECKTISHQSVLCPICRQEGKVVGGRRIGDVRVRRRLCKCVGETFWKTTEGESQEARR